MNELTYHREGDYLIPDLLSPPSPNIGVWGQRRKHYLQQHHDGIYTGLLLSGKLNAHLEEIDRSASELFELLMTTDNDGERRGEKQTIIEGIAADVIDALREKGLSEAICGDLEKHAYSVNDGIKDPVLRNMHVLAAV